MAGKYELKKTKNGQFYFSLKAANGQIILMSERYKEKAKAQRGIKSVQTNAKNEKRFDRRKSKKEEPFFVLKAANGEVVGTSEMYSSITSMENGIASVMKNGPESRIVDMTDADAAKAAPAKKTTTAKKSPPKKTSPKNTASKKPSAKATK